MCEVAIYSAQNPNFLKTHLWFTKKLRFFNETHPSSVFLHKKIIVQ